MVNTIMSTMKKINKEMAVSLTGCGTTQNKNSETTQSMTENDYNKAVEK